MSFHFIVRFEPLPGKEAAFREELLRVANQGTGDRKCVVLSIPESVVLRVHERLSARPIRATRTSTNPRRVVGLAEFHQSLASHRETLSA